MEYYALEVLFVVLNIYICMGINVRIKRGVKNPAFEDIDESSHVICEIISDDVVNCVMLCSDSDVCRSISYNRIDSRCRLFSQDFTGQEPTGPKNIGWIHFDLISDCLRVQLQGNTITGLYSITIGDNQVTVWCDLETEGGGWTVFQRRSDGSVDFHRNWNDYVTGFGDPTREYWIGNDALSILTSSETNELLILLENWNGGWKYARYSHFRVNNGTDKYRLNVEGYSGTAGNKFGYNSGEQFSTRDQDNDSWRGRCTKTLHSGGWWYKYCTKTDLNGIYYNSSTKASNSCHWGVYRWSLRTVFMMARKKVDFLK